MLSKTYGKKDYNWQGDDFISEDRAAISVAT